MEGIIGYSTAPLRLATCLGTVSGVAAVFYLIWVVLEKLIWDIPIPGYTTIIVLILFFGCGNCGGGCVCNNGCGSNDCGCGC